MQRPFEGIRVIDATHVLAGPFAAYQLAVLGADVIKVEHPHDPDQSRLTGSDRELGKRHMGTSYLTQASNKRSLTLDLKQTVGRRFSRSWSQPPTCWSRTTGPVPSIRSGSATRRWRRSTRG